MKTHIKSIIIFSIFCLLSAFSPFFCFAGFNLEEEKIIADDGDIGDLFGNCVSASGKNVIIGAWGDRDHGDQTGSAYIFERRANSWTQTAKLTADDGAAWDRFGQAVAISKNFAIVGAHFDDDKGEDSGAVYIFERKKRYHQGWVQVAKLTPDDGHSGDEFGESVAITDDFALIGAPLDDDNGEKSGSAYIFERRGEYWVQATKLTPDDASPNRLFGDAVALTKNYAIIGAWRDSDYGVYSGAVYIFKRSKHHHHSWDQVAKLTADDADALYYFGYAVSATDNYVIVGADGYNDNAGSAYIFKRNGIRWHQVAKLTANDGASLDLFGRSVSITDDYAIVGAPWDDDFGGQSGAVYIFKRNGKSWTLATKLTPTDAIPNSYFGDSVSATEGFAVIGATADDDNGLSSGSAYIYERERCHRGFPRCNDRTQR